MIIYLTIIHCAILAHPNVEMLTSDSNLIDINLETDSYHDYGENYANDLMDDFDESTKYLNASKSMVDFQLFEMT